MPGCPSSGSSSMVSATATARFGGTRKPGEMPTAKPDPISARASRPCVVSAIARVMTAEIMTAAAVSFRLRVPARTLARGLPKSWPESRCISFGPPSWLDGVLIRYSNALGSNSSLRGLPSRPPSERTAGLPYGKRPDNRTLPSLARRSSSAPPSATPPQSMISPRSVRSSCAVGLRAEPPDRQSAGQSDAGPRIVHR